MRTTGLFEGSVDASSQRQPARRRFRRHEAHLRDRLQLESAAASARIISCRSDTSGLASRMVARSTAPAWVRGDSLLQRPMMPPPARIHNARTPPPSTRQLCRGWPAPGRAVELSAQRHYTSSPVAIAIDAMKLKNAFESIQSHAQ